MSVFRIPLPACGPLPLSSYPAIWKCCSCGFVSVSHELVPSLFWNRKFEPEVIITCVRWRLRFCLSLRDLQELREQGLAVHHCGSPKIHLPGSRQPGRRCQGLPKELRIPSERQIDRGKTVTKPFTLRLRANALSEKQITQIVENVASGSKQK